jgi:hypothetical protein
MDESRPHQPAGGASCSTPEGGQEQAQQAGVQQCGGSPEAGVQRQGGGPEEDGHDALRFWADGDVIKAGTSADGFPIDLLHCMIRHLNNEVPGVVKLAINRGRGVEGAGDAHPLWVHAPHAALEGSSFRRALQSWGFQVPGPDSGPEAMAKVKAMWKVAARLVQHYADGLAPDEAGGCSDELAREVVEHAAGPTVVTFNKVAGRQLQRLREAVRDSRGFYVSESGELACDADLLRVANASAAHCSINWATFRTRTVYDLQLLKTDEVRRVFLLRG